MEDSLQRVDFSTTRDCERFVCDLSARLKAVVSFVNFAALLLFAAPTAGFEFPVEKTFWCLLARELHLDRLPAHGFPRDCQAATNQVPRAGLSIARYELGDKPLS